MHTSSLTRNNTGDRLGSKGEGQSGTSSDDGRTLVLRSEMRVDVFSLELLGEQTVADSPASGPLETPYSILSLGSSLHAVIKDCSWFGSPWLLIKFIIKLFLRFWQKGLDSIPHKHKISMCLWCLLRI